MWADYAETAAALLCSAAVGTGAGAGAGANAGRGQPETLWGAGAYGRRPGLLRPICCVPESLLDLNPRTQLYACFFHFLRTCRGARMEGRGGADDGAGRAGAREVGSDAALVDAPQQTDRCSSTPFTTANSSFAENAEMVGAGAVSGRAWRSLPVPVPVPAPASVPRPSSLLMFSSVYALLLHSAQVGQSSRGRVQESSECCVSSAGSVASSTQGGVQAGGQGGAQGGDICRICFGGESVEQLVRPCACRGSIACVHRGCLERWLLAAASSDCELCRHHFLVKRSHKWGWARALAAWARGGGGRALAEDAWRGAALAAASLLGTARALHACDRLLQAGARRGGLHALAANLTSSLLIGLIGALNGLLTTWVLLKIQDYQVSWQRWRASMLHVRVVLPDDAPPAPSPVAQPLPLPLADAAAPTPSPPSSAPSEATPIHHT